MYAEQGDFARAMAHMEQAVAAAEQRQDPRHLAWQLKNFSRFLFDAGDWRRMREVFARADAMMREADRYYGETWQSRTCPSTVGSTRWWRDMRRRAGGSSTSRWQRIAQMGPISRLYFPTCLLAEADLLAGHPEDARHRLTTLLGDRQTFTPVEHGGRGARLLLAWAEMTLGRHEAAEALAERPPLVSPAVPPRRRATHPGTARRSAAALGCGRRALDEALTLTRAMPYPYAELKALWVYGQLEGARGNCSRGGGAFPGGACHLRQAG